MRTEKILEKRFHRRRSSPCNKIKNNGLGCNKNSDYKNYGVFLMSDVMWIAWLALGILLLIGEMFTVGFFLFWFGLGAIAAAVVAFAGFGIAVQWATFIIVSSVGLLLSRKFALAISKPGPETKMNVDRLIGKTGVVMDDIVPADNKGLVMVASEEWRAVTEDGSVIPQGEKIKVIRIEGTKLVVKAKIPGRWKHMTE